MLIVEGDPECMLKGLVVEEKACFLIEGAEDSNLCLSEKLHLDLLSISKR